MPRILLEKISNHPTATLDKKIEALIEVGIKIAPEPESRKFLPYGDAVTIVCFAHALGLADSSLYRELIYETGGKYGANTPFMEYVLKAGVLTEITSPAAGDVVVYFDKGTPLHAGLLTEKQDVVCSKWGELDLFEHNLWQVPVSYGSAVRFFKPMQTQEAEKLFVSYLDSLGLIE